MKNVYFIDGIYYVESNEIPTVGDLVLDTKDNMYGFVELIKGDKMAVRDGCVIECAVPITRVRKLIPTPVMANLN